MCFYPHITIKTSKEIFTGQLFSYSYSENSKVSAYNYLFSLLPPLSSELPFCKLFGTGYSPDHGQGDQGPLRLSAQLIAVPGEFKERRMEI